MGWGIDFNTREGMSNATPYRVIQSIPKITSMPPSAKRISSVLMILLPSLIGIFLMTWFEATFPPGVDII